MARAWQAGASILLASASPAGRTAGSVYTAVVLTSVRTLSAGDRFRHGRVDGRPGAVGAGNRRRPGTGHRVAAALAGSPVGPVLRAAPVVGGNVMFTAAGCADAADLPAPPDRGPGTVTPGGASDAGDGDQGDGAVPGSASSGDAGSGGASPGAADQSGGSGQDGGSGNGNSSGSGNGNGGGNGNGSGNSQAFASGPGNANGKH